MLVFIGLKRTKGAWSYMSEQLQHITSEELVANGIVSAPDILSGTPAENKARFDQLSANVLAPMVNTLIDTINVINVEEETRVENETLREEAEVSRENRLSAAIAAIQNGQSAILTVVGNNICWKLEHGSTWIPLVSLTALIGPKGEDGYTPIKGTDYWTSSDIAMINTYIDAQNGAFLDTLLGEV